MIIPIMFKIFMLNAVLPKLLILRVVDFGGDKVICLISNAIRLDLWEFPLSVRLGKVVPSPRNDVIVMDIVLVMIIYKKKCKIRQPELLP